jgi:hypothetical protein
MRREDQKNRTRIGPHLRQPRSAGSQVISVAKIGYVRWSEPTYAGHNIHTDIRSSPHPTGVALFGINPDRRSHLGLVLPPALGPKVEHVVHVDVGEQGQTLSRPYLTNRDDPVFQDTRLQPFADKAGRRCGAPRIEPAKEVKVRPAELTEIAP